MKINKAQIIVIWTLILWLVWYTLFNSMWSEKTSTETKTETETVKTDSVKTNTNTNVEKSKEIIVPESEKKWTKYLLQELKNKLVEINPDLVMDWLTQNNNIIYIKFKCNIDDNSVNRILKTTKDANWNPVDIKTISKEQVSLLKKNMENDCNIINSLMISKWMLFINDENALSYSQITPSAYFKKLENILPVEFSNSDSGKKLKVVWSVFSYEDNINQLLIDEKNLTMIKSAYIKIKMDIKWLKSSDPEVNKTLEQIDLIIEHYTTNKVK